MYYPTEVQIQSKIFSDINSNAKPVDPNVLLRINRIINPIESESLAQLVIEKLNEQDPFKKMLHISTFGKGNIKTASIVRFALRYLVTINPSDEKNSLFYYWDGDKDAFRNQKNDAIEEYVSFCSMTLRNYFGAIKKNFSKQWEDEKSMLLSVISINGFIIAFTRQLSVNGVHDFDFYDKLFSSWEYDFSKTAFPYTSSQYSKFASYIVKDVFKIT